MEQLKLVIQTPEPVRLCEYLRRRIGVSARLLARLKRTPAGILCNGVPVRAVDPVRAGDVVVLTMPEQEGLEPNPALYVPSVLETAYYIVYDKPTGMPVHPSARHRRDTLGNYFAASMPGHTFRAVNRLDRDTSGLCMIARMLTPPVLCRESWKSGIMPCCAVISPETAPSLHPLPGRRRPSLPDASGRMGNRR